MLTIVHKVMRINNLELLVMVSKVNMEGTQNYHRIAIMELPRIAVV
jgi:hypothetical protein